MPDTLRGLAAGLNKPDESEGVRPSTVLIDITEFYPDRDASRPVVLEWANPTLSDAYTIGDGAVEALRRNPGWHEQLAMDVSTLGTCHVAPTDGGMRPGIFYEAIARAADKSDGQRAQRLWSYLLKMLDLHFPHLRNRSEDIAALVDLCQRYYQKHPEECGHLPSNVLADLKKMAESRAAVEGAH